MTMATTKEQREILEAYERGEEIEVYVIERLKIADKDNYQFDFRHYDYRIKPKRWRADEDERYYFLNSRLVIVASVDTYSCADDSHFNAGNYFRTAEQAEKAKKLLIEALAKFHEENNEPK